MQEELDHGDAVIGGRLDVLDVVDQGGRGLLKGVVSRPSISSGSRPVYCQATATTGILMLGKMSVGVRRMMTGLMMRMSRARIMKVYGRSRANLTIHIGKEQLLSVDLYGRTSLFYGGGFYL